MDSFIKNAKIRQNEKKPINEITKNSVDEELVELLKKHKAMIKVIGCGGGSNNTINRISEVGIQGAETVAINTDDQDLLYTTADKKILIGKEITQGLGAGSVPRIGEDSARGKCLELLLGDKGILYKAIFLRDGESLELQEITSEHAGWVE